MFVVSVWSSDVVCVRFLLFLVSVMTWWLNPIYWHLSVCILTVTVSMWP